MLAVRHGQRLAQMVRDLEEGGVAAGGLERVGDARVDAAPVRVREAREQRAPDQRVGELEAFVVAVRGLYHEAGRERLVERSREVLALEVAHPLERRKLEFGADHGGERE